MPHDIPVDRRADERGFTMVELVVSLTILAIGIVGVIGVMNSSFGVAVRTNERSRAVALATRELEALRALPYATLALQAQDPALAQTDTRTETVGGTEFTIEKSVVWGTQGSNTKAVVNATAAVRWFAGGIVHDISQSTTVYPGGLGPSATPSGTTCSSGSSPGRPQSVTATSVDANTVDLSWSGLVAGSAPVATWRIEMIANSTSQTITKTQPVSSSAYRIEGLSAGTQYQFRVLGVSACGVVSVDAAITSLVTDALATLTPCAFGTSVVSPASVRMSNSGNGALVSTPKVSVNTTGSCSGLYVKYKTTGTSTVTKPLTGTTLYPLVKTADITSSTNWDIGVHTIELFDNLNVKRGSLLLTICAKNAKTC